MTTPTTWPLVMSILITLGLSIPAPTNLSTMELNLDGATLLLKLTKAIDALQKQCKKEGITVKSLLNTEEYQQYKEEIELIKEHYQQAKTVYKNQGNNQEEIDCGTFSNAVLQWQVEMKNFFKEMRKNYAEVVIDRNQFVEHFSDHQSTFPIVQDLYKEWKSLLASLPDTMAGKELFTALLSNTGATWAMTADLPSVEQHYKQNKKAYKKYQSTMESFRDEAMPKEQYFLDALQASTSEKDPNLPENVEDLGEQVDQLEKDYKAWLNETIKEVRTDTNGLGKSISLALLQQERKDNMTSPAYAQAFWQGYADAVEQTLSAESFPLSYDKASKIAADLLVEHFNQITQQEDKAFFKAAVASQEPVMPYGLTGWLVAAVKEEEPAFVAFQDSYRAWANATAQAVAACENQLKGRDFRVSKAKLKQELTTALNYKLQQASPGLDILGHLEQALPAEEVFSFDALHKTWVEGVNSIQTDVFIQNLWENYIAGTTQMSMTEASSSFLTKLPPKESFVNAILDARYQAPAKKQPAAIQEKIEVLFKVHQSEAAHYAFSLALPLQLIENTNKEGKSLQYAVPVVEGLGDKDINIQDSTKSSTVNSLKAITTSAPVFNYYGDSSTCHTWVTMRIGVTDTTEMRVVQNARNGSLKLLNLSLDARNKIKGVLGSEGKTLGAGIEIKADRHGNIKELQGSVTLLGFDFKVHAGKEGVYMTCRSPFEFKEAVKMRTEGKSSYDLTLSVRVQTEIDPVGATWVNTSEGKRGAIDGEGNVQVGEIARDLKVELTSRRIVIKK